MLNSGKLFIDKDYKLPEKGGKILHGQPRKLVVTYRVIPDEILLQLTEELKSNYSVRSIELCTNLTTPMEQLSKLITASRFVVKVKVLRINASEQIRLAKLIYPANSLIRLSYGHLDQNIDYQFRLSMKGKVALIPHDYQIHTLKSNEYLRQLRYDIENEVMTAGAISGKILDFKNFVFSNEFNKYSFENFQIVYSQVDYLSDNRTKFLNDTFSMTHIIMPRGCRTECIIADNEKYFEEIHASLTLVNSELNRIHAKNWKVYGPTVMLAFNWTLCSHMITCTSDTKARITLPEEIVQYIFTFIKPWEVMSLLGSKNYAQQVTKGNESSAARVDMG